MYNPGGQRYQNGATGVTPHRLVSWNMSMDFRMKIELFSCSWSYGDLLIHSPPFTMHCYAAPTEGIAPTDNRLCYQLNKITSSNKPIPQFRILGDGDT